MGQSGSGTNGRDIDATANVYFEAGRRLALRMRTGFLKCISGSDAWPAAGLAWTIIFVPRNLCACKETPARACPCNRPQAPTERCDCGKRPCDKRGEADYPLALPFHSSTCFNWIKLERGAYGEGDAGRANFAQALRTTVLSGGFDGSS